MGKKRQVEKKGTFPFLNEKKKKSAIFIFFFMVFWVVLALCSLVPAGGTDIIEHERSKNRMIAEREQTFEFDRHFTLATDLFLKKQYVPALAHFRKAEKIRPKEASIGDYITTCTNRIDENKTRGKAREKTRKKMFLTLLREGKDAFSSGKLKQADEFFKKALGVFPGHHECLDWIARVKEETERIAKASLEERKRKDLARNIEQQAENYEKQKKYYSALKKWKALLEIDIDSKKTEFARKRIQRTKNKLGNMVKKAFAKALSLEKNGKIRKALIAYQKVLRIHPGYGKAVTRIRKISASMETKLKTLYERGLVFKGIGKRRKAEYCWKKIIYLMPLASNPFHKKAKRHLQNS